MKLLRVGNELAIRRSPKRVRSVFGFGIAFVVVGAIGWLLFGSNIQEYMRRQRFDPVQWQGEKSFANDVRIRMVDDLLNRHHFHGMALEQVTAIIGEPDKTGHFKDWDLVYRLGPERGWMSIDSEWLVFRLDSQKNVSDYEILRD